MLASRYPLLPSLYVDHIVRLFPRLCRTRVAARTACEGAHGEIDNAHDERAAERRPESTHDESIDELAYEQEQDGIDQQHAEAHRHKNERQGEQHQQRFEDRVEKT